MPGLALIILGVLVLIGLSIWIGNELEKRKRERFKQTGGRLGYSFSHERSPVELPFELFRQGDNRYGRYFLDRLDPHAIVGLDDVRITLFDYHFETTSGSGDDETTHHHHFTCAAVEPGIDLGQVVVRREGLGDRIAAAFGFEDIDFEDPEFSRLFHVSATHRRDAYALLEHDLMGALTDHPEWTFEASGNVLLIHRDSALTPERVESLDALVRDVLGALPRTLVNNERQRRGLNPILDAGAAARRD